MFGHTLKRNNFSLLLLAGLMLAASVASAQMAQPDNNVEQVGAQRSSLTITAAASGERVRITAPVSVVQMHVEIYAASGEKLFDQEIRGGNVFDWHLQDGQAQRLAPGSYVCVVTAKSISGRLTQKIGTVSVEEKSASVQPAELKQLSAAQAQTIGPVEENSSWTIAAKDEPQTPTVIANDGTDGQMIRGRGALTFRIGDFFSGNDKEQMRLTEDGNLGLGTTKPKAKLDVAGLIRAREGFMFSDGSTLNVNEKGVLTRTNADGTSPSAVTATQNKLVKFTDNAGSVGDSVVTELAGNIGIGTATPTQALDVANGRIVTTGSQTLTSPVDSVIEVKTAVTNNADFVASFKARNFFTGSGNGPVGMDIAPTFAPTNSIGLARGFVSAAFFAPPPGVTISEAWGGNAVTIYNNTGGAVTNGTAFAINSPYAFGALKPINQYGLRINNQGLAGANTSYGLFVDAQSGSLNNYSAIFAGGNVGIGTSAPAAPLEVNGQLRSTRSNAAPQYIQLDGGDSGAIKLTAQSNVAAEKPLLIQNLSGEALPGANNSILFQTGTTASYSTKMMISTDGNVGIGTNIPLFKLHVNGGADSAIFARSTNFAGVIGTSEFDDGVRGSSQSGAGVHGFGTASSYAGRFDGNTLVNGVLDINFYTAGGTDQVCRLGARLAVCSSSLRYKTAVQPFRSGLALLNRLRPISFTWKSNGTADLGLGAEDVAAVAPLLVTHNEKGEVEGVKYDRLAVVLINAVKEQQVIIQKQQVAMRRLQRKLASLEKTMKQSRRADSPR